jgi:hypothetical protein
LTLVAFPQKQKEEGMSADADQLEIQQALELINKLSIDSKGLATLAKALAEKVDHGRQESGGRLSYELWIATLQMVGVCVCLEVQVYSHSGELYLKRRKGGEEKEWEGQLHIPGSSVAVGSRGEELIEALLAKEVLVNPAIAKPLALSVKPVGFVWYPEPERSTTAFTIQIRAEVDPILLQVDLEKVTWANFSEVIEQHRPTVAHALLLSNANMFLDTRKRE